MGDTAYKSMKDLPATHLMSGGTPLCAGCGGLELLKQFYDVLGENTLLVNAAGCMSLLAVYPYTPFRGSWLYTSMASAPAGAQGVRDALDVLIRKKRLDPGQDLKVVVLTGDGSAYGMGLSATSGAIERGLDFYYLCYDNEGYGNTGHQSSAATPHAAKTATNKGKRGFPGKKKDLFSIWAAHDPPYVATISAEEPVDLARKLEKAMALKGPKLFLGLAACPTGWHFDPAHTVEIGKMAVKTGAWPLKEYLEGRITHTRPPKPKGRRPPVEEYLRLQGRFAHLFQPKRNDAMIEEIQQTIDNYWEQAG